MVRPTLRFSDDFGAVLKYHSAKAGKTMTQYIAELVYEDLKRQQGQLMQGVEKGSICV